MLVPPCNINTWFVQNSEVTFLRVPAVVRHRCHINNRAEKYVLRIVVVGPIQFERGQVFVSLIFFVGCRFVVSRLVAIVVGACYDHSFRDL